MARNGEVGEGICPHLRHVISDKRVPEQELVSFNPLPVPERPWETISVDFIMGLPRTARHHDAVFTFVDKMTKYVHVIPTTSTIDAEGAARLYLKQCFHVAWLE